MLGHLLSSRRDAAIATILAVTVASLAPAHSHAQAQTPITVTQGDRFYFKFSDQSDPANPATMSFCTVGFNEVAARESLTAGHCARGVTDEVYVDTGYGLTRAGRITQDPRFRDVSDALGDKFVYDQAVIAWDSNVRVGSNVYSGDKKIDASALQVGDEVCFHGANSHYGSRAYRCAPYMGETDGAIFLASGNERGDSGAPIWAPGKGMLGTVSLQATIESSSGDNYPITVGTAINPSTSAFDEERYTAIVDDYMRVTDNLSGYAQRITTRALPTDAPTASLTNASSSTIGIAVGAIAAVLALIAVLAPFANRLAF